MYVGAAFHPVATEEADGDGGNVVWNKYSGKRGCRDVRRELVEDVVRSSPFIGGRERFFRRHGSGIPRRFGHSDGGRADETSSVSIFPGSQTSDDSTLILDALFGALGHVTAIGPQSLPGPSRIAPYSQQIRPLHDTGNTPNTLPPRVNPSMTRYPLSPSLRHPRSRSPYCQRGRTPCEPHQRRAPHSHAIAAAARELIPYETDSFVSNCTIGLRRATSVSNPCIF